MNSRDYFRFVRKSRSRKYTRPLSVIALAEETGELCGAIKKDAIYSEHRTDLAEAVFDEIGDVLYQLCVVMDLYGLNIHDVMEHNHDKLIRRHGGERTAEDGGKR